jgi:hypothetical protein
MIFILPIHTETVKIINGEVKSTKGLLEMHPQKKYMLWINILGGIAVLGSYAWGFITHPDAGNALWGGVPQWLRIIYTSNKLLAAFGYLSFTIFLLFFLDIETARIDTSAGFKAFNVLYTAILTPRHCGCP